MAEPSTAKGRLEVCDLVVHAGARTVLRGISFGVSPGEVVAVLGPNGAGKTTLLEAVAGLRYDIRGTVSVSGQPLRTFHDHAAHLALMPDDEILPEEMTLGEALALSPADALARALELGALLGARASEVSKGEGKRARLCATLNVGRPVVLLDEPFSAFDPRQLRTLLPLFRNAITDKAVVVTVHQLRTAELVADRLLILADGRAIACGTLDELRARVAAPQASLDDVFLRLLDEDGARALS